MSQKVFSAERCRLFIDRPFKTQLLPNRESQHLHMPITDPPSVSIEPTGKVAVNESGELQLHCRFNANPSNVSEILWFRDGLLIELAANMRKLVGEKGFSSLVIHNITRNDTGFYNCHVRNIVGSGNSTTSTYVDVLCKCRHISHTRIDSS